MNLPPPPASDDDDFPRGLLVRHAPELVELVGRLLPEWGAAETVRLTGVPKEIIDDIGRLTQADARRLALDVEAARGRVAARALLQELRRAELRETVLLLAERSADLALRASDAGALRALQAATAALHTAMDEVRAEDEAASRRPALAGRPGEPPPSELDFRRGAEDRAARLRLA